MAHKAVAATLASVVLLTVLVVADATVMSAQDNLAASAQAAQIESGESLLHESLAGGASLQVLAKVQAYLSAVPADCESLPQYLAAVSASSQSSGEDSGIAYSVNATAREASALSSSGAGDDNLTTIAPFAGAVPGALDLREDLNIKEIGGGGSVTLDRNETHTLNLPIEVDSASSLCASTLQTLAGALSRSPCNATLEQADFDSVLPGLTDAASALGFFLTAGWSSGSACSASYWVTLVELGVPGATGSFAWTIRGSGTTA